MYLNILIYTYKYHSVLFYYILLKNFNKIEEEEREKLYILIK